jgi:hypothetical protein
MAAADGGHSHPCASPPLLATPPTSLRMEEDSIFLYVKSYNIYHKLQILRFF